MNKIARAKIRFKPDSEDFGYISFNLEEFKKDMTTLVLNESAHGACLVINRKLIPLGINVKEGLSFLVKIGHLEPEFATIRWAKIIDDDMVKLGLEYEN